MSNPDIVTPLTAGLHAEKDRIRAMALEIERLKLENKKLSEMLEETEIFWTVGKFNAHFCFGWDCETCVLNDKLASAHSRQHGYEIRKCQTNDERFKETNSYAYEVLERLFLAAN